MARNNRRNNNGRANNSNTTSRNREPSTRQAQNNNNNNHLITINDLPTFHNRNRDDTTNEDNNQHRMSVGGYYDVYKKSTANFRNWMKKVLPNHEMVSVNHLTIGAREIYDRTQVYVKHQRRALNGNIDNINDNINDNDNININMIVVPEYIIDELSKSIRYRQLVIDNRFGATSDKGHKYMIKVLKYCKEVLNIGRRVVAEFEKKKKRKEMEEEDNITDVRIVRSFFARTIREGDDEWDEDDENRQDENRQDDDEEEDAPIDLNRIFDGTFDLPFESPEEPDGEEIDIETLINGDDRFQACALLNTMDDYMGIVHQHYGLLKNHLRGRQVLGKTDDDNDGILKLLMECTVVANMATESIQSAENSLKIDHPHVLSFYHVLTIVFMPNFIIDVEKILQDNNCDGKFESETLRRHAVIDFVAKIVESSFHNHPNNNNVNNVNANFCTRVTGIVKSFTRKFGIKSITNKLDKDIAQPIFYYVTAQTLLSIEEGSGSAVAEMARVSGIEAHSWLERSTYIGGDSCILNTQHLIQKLLDVVQSDSCKLVAKSGLWGATFDEKTNPAIRIRGDLDEILAGCILPELITLCMRAPFKCIPERSHLLTMVDLFQQHIKKDRTAPVPISVSFSFHALLTSIFVLQGDGDLARIATLTKQSYNKLFSQLDDISNPSKNPKNTPSFYTNIGMYKQIVNFAKPEPVQYDQFQGQSYIDPIVVERLAFWNPLVGGEFMLLCTYLCSIGLGSATVDTLGQLRLTLHLYNALKLYDPSLGNIPFLNKIEKLFSKTKAVWPGGRPEKGSYAKHFFMSWGYSIANATRLASESTPNMATANNSNVIRKLDEIIPANYSASYESVVQHIFTDHTAAREYALLNATEESEKQHDGVSDLLTRVNLTRDSMDEDEDYFSMNLTAVGCILLKFTNNFSKEMGWDEIISQTVSNNPELRTGKSMGGRTMKQGSFLTSDLNMKRQGISVIWGTFLSQLDDHNGTAVEVMGVDKASTLMKNFFLNIRREEYIYFVKENEISTIHRNPLEGPYPYGRTGMTARDPLQGFLCLKYDKAGKPDTRIIKPGKLTPFIPGRGGFAAPLQWSGPGKSQLERLSNGKYRHIASYNLDELIDLGWDGAMYVSTRGRHAVIDKYVPFINGYDSDSEDEYEPIDVEAGKRAGIIGLSPDEKGKHIIFRMMNDDFHHVVLTSNGFALP